MLKILVLIAGVLFLSVVAAADEEYAQTLGCEHYLIHNHKQTASDASEFMIKHMLERPFNFYSFVDTQKSVLDILGLRLPKDLRELRTWVVTISQQPYGGNVVDPVILRLHRFKHGRFEDVFSYEFPDLTPLLWQDIDSQHATLSHEALLSKFSPFKQQTLKFGDNDSVGFADDVRSDGSRVFLALRYDETGEVVRLEFGLDVPCALFNLYANAGDIEEGYREVIKTPARRYCRIPVLAFEAPQVEE